MNDDLDIAQKKAKLEIEKDLKKIKQLCRLSGYGELFFYIYYLHITRSLKFSKQDKLFDMTSDSVDDVFKYLISCILKFGKDKLIKSSDGQFINLELTTSLTKIAIHINSNYESISFLSLMDNITVFGERNQHVKIDMTNLINSPNYNFIKYGSRLQQYVHNEKSNLFNHNDFLKLFKKEFISYDGLIASEFELNLNDIIIVLDFILSKISTELNKNLENCPKLKNGNINIQSPTTLAKTIKSFSFTIDEIQEQFKFDITNFLNKFIFNPNKFDIRQLGYHMILRQPIICLGSSYIISPQLLLDSLFINFHYTLLESTKVKHDYKKSFSGFFIDKIVTTSEKYDFIEVDRELELYNGKKKIGDIDLILYNKELNQYILVEAKSHSIPLDVYFGDIIAIQKHLKYLKTYWEDKVSVRFKYIKEHYREYNIGNNYKYIIVSKYPEILSHYSDFLVLSLSEYEYYLQNIQDDYKFETIRENLYSIDDNEFEEMQKLREEFTNLSLTPPKGF